MDLRQITPNYAVSPQILPQDMAEIAAAGFKSVMCNRPDGEDADQPEFASIADAAAAAGVQVRWVPISGRGASQDDLDQFGAALNEMPQPLLAYCRTGTRCTMLWSMTQHGTLSDADILQATSEAGYDMSGLLQQLSARG
ncbi:MAG: TIGR01244 family sulfur transferase [Roseovarius sp.]|nr:TIGR01244 family sulfur transferase [Roseovarius sp.]